MKHFSKLLVAVPMIAMGGGGLLVNSAVLPAPSASAASYTITQGNFESAIANSGAAVNGITCDDTEFYCILEAGEYKLGGNVDLTAATLSTANDYGLLFSTGSTTFDLDDKTISTGEFAFIGGDSPNKTIAIKNGTINGGIIAPVYSNLTLSDLSFTGAISAVASTVNILSGTYSSDSNLSVIMPGEDATYNISGGTFSTTGFGIPVIMMNNDDSTTTNTLNISGGTFTAASGAAIDLNNEEGYVEGPVAVNISGGTFAGANGGLHVMAPSLNTVKLTGGTFTATSAGDSAGAIVAWDGQASSINGFLGAGYNYTNDAITTKDYYGVTIAYIDGTTTVTLSASGDDDEEAAATTDETSSESVGTPDSGRMTSEGGSATASALATAAAATVVASGAYLAKKHLAKKNA